MSDRIEVIEPTRHRPEIDLAANDPLTIPQWAGEQIAQRIDDATAAARDDCIRILWQI